MIYGQFNAFHFNAGRFNAGAVASALATDLVVFDNTYSLHNGTTQIVSSIHDSGPERDIIGERRTRDDGLFYNSSYWVRKIITVEGNIVASSQTELDSLMDTMRKRLRVPQANLDLNYNSGSRRYVVSLSNQVDLFPMREHYHINWMPFSAKFECREPFATDQGYTNTTETITSSPINTVITNSGTIEGLPIIILIFIASNTVTVINIKNTENDDEIEYSGAIIAGDTLEFNSEEKFVKLNSTEVDYSGSFPKSDLGGNSYQITITGTSFELVATYKTRNRYL